MPEQKIVDATFLGVAKSVAKLSSCVYLQVGCVIVKDGRPISMGYNGTPKGFRNCCDQFPEFVGKKITPDSPERLIHHEFSQKFEIHAEQNALIYAARTHGGIDGATLYCTLQPCHTCLKMICQSGIKRVVYCETYDLNYWNDAVYEMIKVSNVEILQMSID